MQHKLQRLPPMALFALGIAIEKAFSFVGIPLVAAYLTPADYGRLDVAASLIEIVGLLASLGIADTVIRFAASAPDAEERRQRAACLLGVCVVAVLAVGGPLIFMTPAIGGFLSISVAPVALQVAVGGAVLTALVELPLIWLRLQDRIALYVVVTIMRSAVQIVVTWLVLRSGFGVEGALTANGILVAAFASGLVIAQVLTTGISFRKVAFRQVAAYGIPLVAAAVAMFVLGSCTRLFLNGDVTNTTIAHFGLASKLALIAPLLLQPFALWWNPKRLLVLQEADGLAKSATVWGIGFAILSLGSVSVCLFAPAFIELAFTAGYHGAQAYVPWLVLVCVLNELNTLCNVGCYTRRHGMLVLQANLSGAAAALSAYALLGPWFGVAGIIFGMALGHVIRLVVVLWTAHRYAPIPYPVAKALVAALVSVALIALSPAHATIAMRLIWACVSMGLLLTVLLKLRLLSVEGWLRSPVPTRAEHAGAR